MNEYKKQITELTILNEELENYFRNTIIPQLFVDGNLNLRKFTPPAMKQFNLTNDDIGKPIADIKDNLRFPSIIENIDYVVETGEILEKEIQTVDFRWYQMNILPYITLKDGKTNGVIITFVEITARINDLKEQESLIAEHELLLDTISHDIKTPLTGLGLTLELLKLLPQKGMERFPALIQNAEKGLLKMKDIIYQLTESRWQQHRYKTVEELLSFEHIFEDVRLTLAPQILESEADIEVKAEVSEIMYVRRKLRSIVYNLVNNAKKYKSADRKPKILIKTFSENNDIILTVADNGIGIRAENLATIFTKYQRVENLTEGNGLGLYLIKEIINRSGGQIYVESEFGKGTTFKIVLQAKINVGHK